MIPDIPDSKSPPAYSSFHAPISSPLSPPLITLTDVTQNGAVDKILFSEYEPDNGRYHQMNGWCDAASKQSSLSHVQYPKSSSGCVKNFTDASAHSLSAKNCLHGQTHKHISQNMDRRDGFSSSVSNKRMATNDFQMQNGTLITNYENMNVDESKSHDQVGSVDFEKI